MNFQEYDSRLQVIRNAYALGREKQIICSALGLAGEVGEVTELIKKELRDDIGLSPLSLKKELGDVLCYLVDIGAMYGISLEDIASTNIEKLESRLDRGTLHGSGDNR